MVNTLKNSRKIKSPSKSKELVKPTQSKSLKSKLEWANELAMNADLAQIRALL
ncbi:MAG: hypothetical protein MUF58_07880 [Arcicella sp.]|jgi:hypothetical protein|nr:hypothetical protein [Arcicella sp.]